MGKKPHYNSKCSEKEHVFFRVNPGEAGPGDQHQPHQTAAEGFKNTIQIN